MNYSELVYIVAVFELFSDLLTIIHAIFLPLKCMASLTTCWRICDIEYIDPVLCRILKDVSELYSTMHMQKQPLSLGENG